MDENKNNEMKKEKSNDTLNYNMPIYLQLRELVRNKIDEGEYLPGTAIPSENKLAEIYGINRLTVRNAVDALVHEGVLHRVQGKGVFVVGNRYVEELEEHGGFVSSMSGRGHHVVVKELEKVLRPAGNKFANLFNLEVDDKIFYLKHFKTVDGEPISVEEIYIPQEILPELEMVNSSVFSMKDIFAFYGIELYSMRQSLEVVNGLPKTRKLLNIPDGVAVSMLSVEYFDKTGRLIEYSQSMVRSDKCSFMIKLH